MGLGINVMAVNLGAIAGYTLGGVMITYFGWQSIFWLNIPIGIFGTIWGYLNLKEIIRKPVGQKFDFAGSILYCIGLATILLALTIGDPLSVRNLVILGCGAAFFVAVIFVELRQKFPTLDLTLFKIRQFALGNIAGFLNAIAFSCGPFLRSLYLQLILGYSPAKTGILLIPMEVIIFAISPLSGRLSDKYGAKMLSCIGLLFNASALFWFASFSKGSSYGAVLGSLVLFGFGMALFFPPNSSAVMGSVSAEKRGIANGIRMTLNQTGNVFSVPFSLLLMTLVMPYTKLSQIVGSSQLLSSNEGPIFLKAINHACFILGVITLFAIIPSLGLRFNKDKQAK
jgi:MFS family permease